MSDREPRLYRLRRAFTLAYKTLSDREGVAATMAAIAREVNPAKGDSLIILDGQLRYVRRVTGRSVWIWYEVTEREVFFDDLTTRPPWTFVPNR